MKLPNLVFNKILDFVKTDDVANLRAGLKDTCYEEPLEQRLNAKNLQPFICHLCLPTDIMEKFAKLFIDPEFLHAECWTVLIEEIDWRHNGLQLQTKAVESLNEMDPGTSNAFIRHGREKFHQKMSNLKAELPKLKADIAAILKDIPILCGAKNFIAHIEKTHRHKKNLLDVYHAIEDEHNFHLDSTDVRVNLNPNTFIGIHHRNTFMSIGQAYLLNDTYAAPLNRHLSLSTDLLLFVSIRDLLEKTIEVYEELILFKPPYEISSQFEDEYYRERLRILHCKKNLAIFYNVKIILDMIIPYKF